MDADSEKQLIILSDIIRARYCLRNELLFSNEYSDLPDEGTGIVNIPYCEIRNTGLSALVRSNSISVAFKSDLVFVYECVNSNSGLNSFKLFTEKLKRHIDIHKSKFLPSGDFPDNIKCYCRISGVSYFHDIDLACEKIFISVHADIECLIIEEGEVRLTGGQNFILGSEDAV